MENFCSTIAAIATAFGRASISTIRISGPQALEITDKIFKSVNNKKLANSVGYRAYYGYVVDKSGNEVDEAVALVFRSPKSYTGEDVVEISCHGGLFVSRKTLSLLLENGAEIASRGEFTKRAFLNGKISLTEAESVLNIIKADSEISSRVAITSKNGKLDQRISEISNSILDLIANINARADYPDDDTIPSINSDHLKCELDKNIINLQKLADSFNSGKLLRDGINTVIVGQPNVGKSTLMNLLTEEETSIITDIPGTTRDIIAENILIDGIIFNISDTAGLRDTNNDIEKIGIKKATDRLSSADLILFVMDGTDKFDTTNYDFIKSINSNAACIAIINKCDLSGFDKHLNFRDKFKSFVNISAKTGFGLDKLKKEMLHVINFDNIDPTEAILFTERQRETVLYALDRLKEAIQNIDAGFCLDAVAVILEDALQYLFQLKGKNVSNAVLDSIFSKFCVGK